MTSFPKSLYVTRNGLLEPLGQSQVLSYLKGLSKNYHITLITYEKSDDWGDTKAMQAMQDVCDSFNIRWLPQRFHSRPKYFASAWSVLRLVWLIYRETGQGKAQLVHARSYIPAAAALMVHRLNRTPFIFDMRALWPEELITANRLKRGSLLHRVIVSFEKACIKHAAGVVALTKSSVRYLTKKYPDALAGKRITIIPTCADLERFTPDPDRGPVDPRVHGCIGTVVSGWFQADWLTAWYETAIQRDPESRFEIITRDDPQQVHDLIDRNQKLGDRLHVAACTPAQMPDAIRNHSYSIMVYAGGHDSELGRSPTRMAEVLGCGMPVVVNEGVGDVAEIVREHRVGVVLEGASDLEINKAMDELDTILNDVTAAQRCRDTAEALFSLEGGVALYQGVYRSILGGSLFD